MEYMDGLHSHHEPGLSTASRLQPNFSTKLALMFLLVNLFLCRTAF